MTDGPGRLGRFAARVRGAVRRRYEPLREYVWWRSPVGLLMRRRLRRLRGLYRGRRCFVMGNGPSLLRIDIRRLRDEITIGSNALFLIFEEMGYQPTFLTVEDTLVAEDRATALNAIRGSTKIFPHDLSYCLERDADTVYCNFARNYGGFPRFSDRFDRVVYWGGTVSFLNLQLAYHLGCNPVYLVGFDHSYRVPPNLMSDQMVSDEDDVNHIHPDYFGKGFRWHDPMVWRMEQAYRFAEGFLSARGVRVYNATAGGQLEVFPRIDFNDVLGGSAP